MTETPNNRQVPPSPDEIEVSILGPGFGECVLIHPGAGRWLIIDSCIDATTKRPAALDYLRAIGVQRSSVDFIIATHWHADHIRGLAALVAEYDGAQVCCSGALRSKEFLAIANLYADLKLRLPTGPSELQCAFETVRNRPEGHASRSIRWLRSDMLVFRDHHRTSDSAIPVLMSALSPSDEMITRAQEEIALQYRVCKQSEQVTMLTPVQPNHVSVALHLEVGGRRILLGSDLEETGDPQIGWSAVLSSIGRPDASAGVFKVAHHGAQSGHSDAVWTEMVEPNPLALLTPFRWGRCRLPDADDRRRILALTDKAFITAHPERDVAPRKRTSKVEQMIAGTARKRWVAAGSLGHVRWRADLLQEDDAGSIDLFGAAMLLGNVA
jgi:beta-lactamase superfamily II metal-dependent hydrolase